MVHLESIWFACRVLAKLRNRTFFSLGELNVAIAELVEVLNSRPFPKRADGKELSNDVRN